MPDNELNPVVGIDLGTTFSCISRWADDRAEIYRLADGKDTLPSIVHMQENGKPLVGKFARPRLITDPEDTVEHIKRMIGETDKRITLRGKEYSPVDISAMILERLKADVHKRYPDSSGFEIAGAIVTHPHYFTFPQIAQTEEAAKAAGLPVIRLLSEPVAAALNYGFQNYRGLEEDRQEKILVFDLGGGTFDVTVIQVTNTLNELAFKVLSVGGDAMLGGTNFDDALFNWAATEEDINFDAVDEHARIRAKPILSEAVLEAKEQLSAMDETFLMAANILPDQHVDREVSREQFQEIIKEYCQRIRGIVSTTLAAAGLREGELDKTIMIGGSSRIPIMQQIVEDETGAQPWANADKDLAVANGAAFLAAIEDGRIENIKKEIVVEEATSHALGLRAKNDAFSVLIPANRTAPCTAVRQYQVNGDSFTVHPYQGAHKRGAKVTDADMTALKPIEITGVQTGSDGLADVDVTFIVNEQQILRVKIEAPGVHEERQLEF
jgi:molecular chaperone DnaK (HSP70)